MFSASDLISALLERPRSRLWFRAADARPAGEFPPGWRAWFAAMRERIDAVRGATAEAIVAIFLGRELARPAPRSPLLNDWQSFAALWRQQWHPASEDQRRHRIVALTTTLLVHLVLFVLLLWLATVRIGIAPPPQGEDVVQVEYIGEGTPDSPGGGAKESAAPATQTQAKPAASPAAAQPPAPASSVATSEQPPAQTPAEAMPLPDQPLVVTETPLPDPRFALPPTSPPQLQPTPAQPRIEVPLQSRAVPLAEQPQPLPNVATPQLQAQQATPTLRANTPALSAREIPLRQALPQVATPALQATKPATAPTLQAQAPLQSRAVPLQPGTTTTLAPGAAPATAPSSAPSGPVDIAKRQPSSGTLANTATPGSGPSTAAKPGAWLTPKRGDDWGDSTRNRPGANAGDKQGLLNSDGTPRLPAGNSPEPGGGYPPGYDTWTREAIDRNGTWLKRPPNDYTPTRFDQYWLPRETLLEEWVRKGIKQTEIPIPGTSKKIHCVISILQLGGGCYVTDPNMKDQEAVARPPPDIPWKPDLQEDQDSLKKPPQP
ncbi:hypothetical protein FNZ56_03215 [Pseudoluteimonas lycopersici]|uniref:Transmembrane repetitive protein n=1 Tax=Pseudoluteimonas lycopersici TaxID=1324796 RepID=A0A516V375_9GAMM|nr:hypothetical protein [Lysobacter lycopersici]QDQ72954.1 hypothetical protein FNZ56_03215 [Lysobacter lycopersici]